MGEVYLDFGIIRFIYQIVYYGTMAEIVTDRRIRHGKPIIKGTRITVDEVLEMLEAGMTYEEIKKEYGLAKEQVIAVIKYASSMIKGEAVFKISSART